METELYWRLRTIVVIIRGLPLGNVERYLSFSIWDNGALWDIATQGPIPTLAEINAVTQAQIDACKTNGKVSRRDKELWTPQILALTRAVHQRLRDANVDNMTMGVFRAMVETEYDAIN